MFNWRRTHAIQLILSLIWLMMILGCVTGYLPLPLLQRLDWQIYDVRLRATMPNTIDPNIVIIDIDEKSLSEVGRWPWSRDKLAALNHNLFEDYQAALVGYDIFFSEPEQNTSLIKLKELAATELSDIPQLSQRLDAIANKLDPDQQFADSLQHTPSILGYYFKTDNSPNLGVLPRPSLDQSTLHHQAIATYAANSYSANIALLQANVVNAGHVLSLPDADGINRRSQALIRYKNDYYESFSLAIVQAALEMQALTPKFKNNPLNKYEQSLEWLAIGEAIRLPVGKDATALIPFRGEQGSFEYISATDILQKRLPAHYLKNKIVLVGTTATGLFDLRSTPVSEAYPGVEIHANLISGMLNNTVPHAPTYLLGAEFLQILLASGILLLVVLRKTPLFGIITLISLAGGIVFSNFMLWKYQHLAMPLANSFIALLGVYLINITYGYFFETRRRKQLSNLFGQYVPPELVNKMSQDPEQYSMEGQNKELSILFSDVRNFTSLSESMQPRELALMMNTFLTALTKVTREEHLGTIDKYIGDCLMAFWGAPFPNVQHAQQSVLAALAMQTAMQNLSSEFKAKGWPVLQIGVGINTGFVTVGDMGSQYRKSYTALGDAVNLAARLESLTKYYGVSILVGQATKIQTPDIIYRELDCVMVKGKHESVRIYEPIGLASQVSSHELHAIQLFSQILVLYRKQHWDQAEIQLLNLQSKSQHPIYTLYLERIKQFRKTPPAANWLGEHIFSEK